MVQQTIDSMFSEYGRPSTETGLANHDKQWPLPVTSKKTALRDLQNDNIVTVPKSIGSSLFQKDNGSKLEILKASGTKRPTPECVASPSHHQSLASNATNGHLVYVRRRPEAELAKTSNFDNTSNDASCPNARKLGDQEESAQQKLQKEPKICTPEVAPMTSTSSMCFSSGITSVPLSLGDSSHVLQSVDSDCLPVCPAISPLDIPKRSDKPQWEERYCQLLDLLKILDQSNQEDYLQKLHSLSSVELSRHALELERRSIQLSLEEAKEVKRVQLLDVLGKYSKSSQVPSAQHGQ